MSSLELCPKIKPDPEPEVIGSDESNRSILFEFKLRYFKVGIVMKLSIFVKRLLSKLSLFRFLKSPWPRQSISLILQFLKSNSAMFLNELWPIFSDKSSIVNFPKYDSLATDISF